MSYDIYIGQAEPRFEWDDEPDARWEVEGMAHPEAPFTDDMTGRGNSRHPGYGQWAGFLRATGLYDHFFKDPGLMARHPGCAQLHQSDLQAFEAARTRYVERNPDKRPGSCKCNKCAWPWRVAEGFEHDPLLDFNLCRLEWLIWWTRYALTNCSRPAISNR